MLVDLFLYWMFGFVILAVYGVGRILFSAKKQIEEDSSC